MTAPVTIELPGEPYGKGRPRFGRGQVYTPARTRSYEDALRWQARLAMRARPILCGPLSVKMLAYMTIAKGWSKKKRAEALCGKVRPTKKPDADNLLKTLDACNGIVWGDDSQIVHAEVSKHYSDNPRLSIAVQEISAEGEANDKKVLPDL